MDKREKLLVKKITHELKAAIAAAKIEAIDLKAENEYLQRRLEEEGHRLHHE